MAFGGWLDRYGIPPEYWEPFPESVKPVAVREPMVTVSGNLPEEDANETLVYRDTTTDDELGVMPVSADQGL